MNNRQVDRADYDNNSAISYAYTEVTMCYNILIHTFSLHASINSEWYLMEELGLWCKIPWFSEVTQVARSKVMSRTSTRYNICVRIMRNNCS